MRPRHIKFSCGPIFVLSIFQFSFFNSFYLLIIKKCNKIEGSIFIICNENIKSLSTKYYFIQIQKQ